MDALRPHLQTIYTYRTISNASHFHRENIRQSTEGEGERGSRDRRSCFKIVLWFQQGELSGVDASSPTPRNLTFRSSGAAMSKEEAGCKLASVYKHKERKPKKPHYIPRPWGKPYNYKCFQCPFTCMEKSHLYNHMKYSLCKNSLSLLIESDWPYKKGNLLHPDLRLLHATEASRTRGRPDEPEVRASGATGTTNHKQAADRESGGDKLAGTEDVASERMSDETNQFQEEEEEEEEELSGLLQDMDSGEKKEKAKEVSPAGEDSAEPDMNTLLFRFKNKRDKPCKDPTPDFIITDVFSLKKHVVKGKEPPSPLELEAKPKHCKIPKKCPGAGGVLMEQWKLVANGQRRGASEVPTLSPDGNIIPCYPPPAYGEYHEPQSLNLSLLGINYPLNPNLFSYLSPSVTSSTTPHSHLTQLPFLASTAQLMHPHSAHFQPLQNPERSAFLPRFYYPLLFEHSFGSAENKMAATKPEAQQQPAAAMPAPPQAKTPTEPPKAGLLKVPVLKTGHPWVKGFREEPPPPETSHKALLLQAEEEKWLLREKESGSFLGVNSLCRKPVPDAYRSIAGLKEGAALLPNSVRKAELSTATCLDSGGNNHSNLKRKFAGNSLDFVGADVLTPAKVTYQASSLRAAPMQPSKSLDHWHVELHACPPEDQEKIGGSDILSPIITPSDHLLFKPSKAEAVTVDPRDPEATTVLIGDLSKTLEEYQDVEKKLSDLAKEDSPAQKQLRDQLIKIRQELFHIHQALEKAAKPSEGPLDLSVKRSSRGLEKGYQDKKEPKDALGVGKVYDKDPGSINRCLVVGEASEEDEASDRLVETENKTIDLLIKMSRSEALRRSSSSDTHLGAVIKAEVLPLTVPLELRHVMEPYYSRTTKCEADSSVLLCTDGRPNPNQGPPLPVTEDIPAMGCRAIPRSLSCGLPNETDRVCIHSPINTDP
ncbi:proline-rich protein 35 [Lacerta agilis]|uniref:proline-rich protein 35 n=1 Tax=Lacerta agilis TaxID=80427 RepID=UPI001419600C|nr:proline-rich protein 35 [Lacerta agilis]